MTDASEVLASVDVGTNTLLGLVGRVGPDGAVRVLEDVHTITRLGEGVDRTGALSEAAMARALDALDRVAQRAGVHAPRAVRVVATSAVRRASNRAGFLASIQARLGALLGGACVEVGVVDGTQEAALTFDGRTFAACPRGAGAVAVFDIGGGSTEVVRCEAGSNLLHGVSVEIGSVRLTEQFPALAGRTDPGTLRAAREAVHAAFARSPAFPSDGDLMGLAATVTTVRDLAGRSGERVDRDDVDAVIALLADRDLPARCAIACVDPGRADVILAGALLCEGVLVRHGRASFRVGDGGVRVGALRALARDRATSSQGLNAV